MEATWLGPKRATFIAFAALHWTLEPDLLGPIRVRSAWADQTDGHGHGDGDLNFIEMEPKRKRK